MRIDEAEEEKSNEPSESIEVIKPVFIKKKDRVTLNNSEGAAS